jgi:[protein-PII] uridylyltransferase
MTEAILPSNSPSDPARTFFETGDALTALAERTAAVDRLVEGTARELLLSAVPAGFSVLAVGGYGRRHLFPYSDVDLLLLVEAEALAQEHKPEIAAFLQRLWDAGLRVSHSVRTVEECTSVHDRNTELNISLIDQRYLAGDRALYASMAARLPRFIQANREALIRNLARLTHERHAKYGNTFYHLEPNIKDTPGGLRDFQLLCWLNQLHDTDATRVTAPELSSALRHTFVHLARLRCFLHFQAGRDSNSLSFEAQDAIAEQWEHGEVAAWMREYYRHARAVYHAAMRQLDASEASLSSLLAQFRNWRSRLSNSDFSVHRERAHIREPQQLDTHPELVLRLFEFVGRHGFALSFEAEERIAGRLDRLKWHFTGDQPLGRPLEDILSLPYASLAMRGMHETGLLTVLFPELKAIECQVIRDFYHRYTVDEHTLVAMHNLRAVEGPYREILAEVTRPGILMFALLFHDSGKGTPEAGHVAGSVGLAEQAALRIGMPAADRDLVRFLIASHLGLSEVMQSRDTSDPQAIAEIARRMGTVERLKALTLLTYADISAVNPSAMTPWRSQQLWQVYLRVYRELTRELETDRIEAAPAIPPERVAFLEGFPTRYLRTHGDAEIDEHMALELRARPTGFAVEIRRRESVWQLTLVARDRPGLFASVAGTLSSFGMNIVQAEAFSNRRGLILDTFNFEDPMRTLELNPTEVDRLRSSVEKVISGRMDVKVLLRNRPKPKLPSRKAGVASRVAFNAEASATATLVEIVAQDRPGLLYDLASTFSRFGANIEVVLIDTQAHKAIDVFYITAEGKKLTAEKQKALETALRTAIQQ